MTAGELGCDDYVNFLAAISNAAIHRRTTISVLKNGEEIYAAELAAIHAAQHSVNLESYEFIQGEVARRFVEAMTERARAGVKVKVVIDAMGSLGTHDSYFAKLREAGGRVEWYHPVRWYSWPRINNRTHRKLLIVDGKVAFCGGADWADEWLIAKKNAPAWRDTMFQVEGSAVGAIQAVFAENWLESSGDILTGVNQFPAAEHKGDATALVVNSTPHSGQTRARILFQILLESAHRTIDVTTPYFLPDKAARRAMIRAVQERGVRVRVLTAGRRIDHAFVRHLSHSMQGSLLKNGVEIHDYEPSMIHAKVMTIDDSWSVVGSANFDHRSFGLNDEVNIAVLNEKFAARLVQDFESDLEQSKRFTYEQWRKRSVAERAFDFLISLLVQEE
ncbi:MAG TPA: phospholipase D-like domain-containing protein [Candidatus Acidoferrales bacterium]|nr:phospholipase D-like domain-containing protein [Candidatus Acidoferrales bacterium]